MNYIVTTTIHSPTEAIFKFCDKKDWNVIIVGDIKTPHNEYYNLEKQFSNTIYLNPDTQEKMYNELSDIIGWNTVDRRNIGFTYAHSLGAQIIASVDDDNIPYEDWGKNLLVNKEVDVDMYIPDMNVFDPLSITDHSYLWHRGYPIEYLSKRLNVVYGGIVKRKVMVQADLWDGDPDIDAIARITINPDIRFNARNPYCSNVISPFNSQNTFLSRSAFPYYAVLPFIGRMDDIWGSYLFQRYFPNSVIYSKASVIQIRNVQNLVTNLEDEMIGYKNTLNFILSLNNPNKYLPLKTQRFYEVYRNTFKNN